jgi:hypothetical protein
MLQDILYSVTDLLRAVIVESQQPSVARQRPVNNNNKRAIGGGVFYWVRAEAL